MRLAAILSGLILSLAASAAFACPQPDRCGGDRHDDGYAPPAHDEPAYDVDRYSGGDEADAPGAWEDERGLYIRGYRGEACDCQSPPPCGCQDQGLTLSSSFFDGAGGVGGVPDGGYYGGGGYYYVAQGGGSAYAFASASARASASVSYRGGYSYRSHGGHKGGGKHH